MRGPRRYRRLSRLGACHGSKWPAQLQFEFPSRIPNDLLALVVIYVHLLLPLMCGLLASAAGASHVTTHTDQKQALAGTRQALPQHSAIDTGERACSALPQCA
ncbi:hypothetical protein TRVL_08583 [Trypanosoma vivax]|nr:hypothetical protein TRVL_08583 [Trypanosoma vivax]